MARSPNAERVSHLDVLPLQPVCPHEQSMSGVFSIASHWVLQYFPDVVTHEQMGCAHFSAFAVAISFLLASDQQRGIQDGILNTWEKRFCPIKDISQFWVPAWSCGHLGGAATPAEVLSTIDGTCPSGQLCAASQPNVVRASNPNGLYGSTTDPRSAALLRARPHDSPRLRLSGHEGNVAFWSLRKARAKGKRFGRTRRVLDASRIASLRCAGRSWRTIARQLGCFGQDSTAALAKDCGVFITASLIPSQRQIDSRRHSWGKRT